MKTVQALYQVSNENQMRQVLHVVTLMRPC